MNYFSTDLRSSVTHAILRRIEAICSRCSLKCLTLYLLARYSARVKLGFVNEKYSKPLALNQHLRPVAAAPDVTRAPLVLLRARLMSRSTESKNPETIPSTFTCFLKDLLVLL